jgi:hypothetical protein
MEDKMRIVNKHIYYCQKLIIYKKYFAFENVLTPGLKAGSTDIIVR